ncbi:MAG TPA: tetratricopeptide repeat protein [Flavobacterium lutivivi]|nr:tetratricopeptide repeat protein [Flavobacterium lutivivi]
MRKRTILSFAMLTSAFYVQAQDIEQANKATDAEQYEKAKGILKSIIQSKPSNGKATFLLGNVYLKQNIADSAKIYFQRGLSTTEGAKFNNIGLAQMDLDADNKAAAQAKFDLVTKDMKKKDIEEYVYIARAYMNSDKPDYKKAIEILTKAKAINPTDAQVQLALGDAYYGDKNQNEAYVAYRNAYQADNTLLRAKMQLGVLLKGAKAFNEAVKAYNEVIAINPNYGPVYRELAETYYLWGNTDLKNYNENIQKALGFYEKYMSLTDYSISSRMRHADFLIIAKDYKALEAEANKMKELDGINPRIFRYLGYSSFENGNYDAALKALQDYISNPDTKKIAMDYLYLGKTKLKKGVSADGKTIDNALLTAATEDLKRASEMDPALSKEFNETGKAYFGQKLYGVAAKFFELAMANQDSKTAMEDSVYYAICVITDNRNKDAKTIDKVSMEKADKALDFVITKNPDYSESYFYKGRIYNMLENDEAMATNYQKYIDLTLAKGEAEVAKSKTKLIESYNNMASHYANFDKAKAKELLSKTLELNPADSYALEAMKLLK